MSPPPPPLGPQPTNHDACPSRVGACFLRHEIMTESLYAGLISVALVVSYPIALCTHPVKGHFSLRCLCSAPSEMCPRGTNGLGICFAKPPSLPCSALERIQGTEPTLTYPHMKGSCQAPPSPSGAVETRLTTSSANTPLRPPSTQASRPPPPGGRWRGRARGGGGPSQGPRRSWAALWCGSAPVPARPQGRS